MSDLVPEASPHLPIGLFNADRLDDAALRRAGLGASSAVAFRQKGEGDVSARWAAVNPEVPIEDAGEVGDVRDAILGCAQRKIVVLASSTPDKPERFVGRCLQGAAASRSSTSRWSPCTCCATARVRAGSPG